MSDTTSTAETCEAILAELSPELRGGDDRALWELVVRAFMSDVAKLDSLDPAPRHLFAAFARVPARPASRHPDAEASLFLAWEHERGEPGWRFVGSHPRVKRQRGAYTASVCVPQGTTRLAYADVLVLWRPHLPWAPPEDTEMGRQTYRFRRDPDSRWRFGGVREG